MHINQSPPSGKGKALIISISYQPPNALASSQMDRFYMKEIFQQLGYEICEPANKNEWTEQVGRFNFTQVQAKHSTVYVYKGHCDYFRNSLKQLKNSEMTVIKGYLHPRKSLSI